MSSAQCPICEEEMKETLLYFSDTPFKRPGMVDYLTGHHGHICKNPDHIDCLGPIHSGSPMGFVNSEGVVAIEPEDK